MSNIYDCSTPASSVHLETTDSDEVNECYVYYDKHADSIMPTASAQELLKRKNGKKSGTLLEGLAIQQGFGQRLGKIIANFNNNKETFKQIHNNKGIDLTSTPDKAKKGAKGLDEKEIKEKLMKLQINKLLALKKLNEDSKNKVIDQKRDDIQKVWRSRMFELNGKLQQAEWSKANRNREEKERIKGLFEKAFEKALSIEKDLLFADIDEHYQEQYREKLKNFRARKEENAKKIEEDLRTRCEKERERWKDEEEEIKKRAADRMDRENEEILHRALSAERQKCDAENKKLLDRLLNRLEVKEKKISSEEVDLEKWKEEARAELRSKVLLERTCEFKDSIAEGLKKEIKRAVSLNIESKVIKNEQERVFREISDELNSTLDLFKREIEAFYRKENSEIESDFLKKIEGIVKEKAEKRLALREKELQIKYMKKLENLKNEIKKELDEKHLEEIKNFKQVIFREKTKYAQYKAKTNILISKLSEEISSNLHNLEDLKIDVKAKEKANKRLEEEIVFKPDEIISKSPKRPKLNGSSLVKSNNLQSSHEFLGVQIGNLGEIRAKNDSNLRNTKTIEIPYKQETSKQEMSKLETYKPKKEHASSNSLSFDCLKLKSKEGLSCLKIRQSVYHDLLKEKFGFIKPRLK